MLVRLAVRPDAAMALAALGLAAATLLPVVANLVLAGLDPDLPAEHVAYAPAGEALDAASVPQATWIVAQSTQDPTHYAYVQGDPQVAVGAQLAMPDAASTSTAPRSAKLLPGLPPDGILVHPDDLGPSRTLLALLPGPTTVPGAHIAPARGADAFEAATTASLRDQATVLVLLSIPAVALVASAFARQEIRARRRQSATLSALGGRWHAVALLGVRMTLTAGLGAVVATGIGFALYTWGPPFFHPDDAPRRFLAISIALPAALAALTGWAWSLRASRRFDALRQGGPTGEDDAAWPWPAAARPILLGVRPLTILVLAALLFAADVGFPLAAAQIPTSLLSGDDEWVIGADNGLVVGQGVDARIADIAWADARIGAILAETVSPTLLDGRPTMVRGADWDALASYHGLRLKAGQGPGDTGIVLGEDLAGRLGVGVGTVVVVQGASRPDLLELTVSGIATGPDVFRSEAFVTAPTGRRLAGLAADQATVLHVRPPTPGAAAAVQQQEPNLVLHDLRIEPTQPTAGSIAEAVLGIVNLGRQDGQRTLTLRVNGEAVATQQASAPGLRDTTLRIPFIVPAGPVRIDINPSAEGEAQPAHRDLLTPTNAAAGQPFTVTMQAQGAPQPGVRLGVFRDLAHTGLTQAVLTATTDAAGNVSWTLAAGAWVVGTLDEPRVYKGLVVTGLGGIEVEAVWTEPGTPILGELGQLRALVRNHGTATANATLPAFAGDLQFAERDVTLQGGEATTVSFTLLLVEPVETVAVGDRTLELGAAAQGAAPQGPAILPSRGQVAQAKLADRALGDARGVLTGLAGSAIASTLAIVGLATRRTLAGRQHVTDLLRVLGWDAARIRQRAALEGAILGALAALVALVPAKLAFQALGRWGPVVFGHGLPDPVDLLFVLQTMTAFAGVCALAAYFASAKAAAASR